MLEYVVCVGTGLVFLSLAFGLGMLGVSMLIDIIRGR